MTRMSAPSTLGADLRALRKARGMTLEVLAARLGVSVGWLSQVERDISSPDMAMLRRIADVFAVPLSLFFGTSPAAPGEEGRVVRAGARRAIGQGDGGLVEALLSPDLTDDFEVIHSTFMPGSRREVAARRQTCELAYLLSGRLDVWLDEQRFSINAGDSFRIRGQAMRWANPHDEPAVAIWVISPPVY